MSSRLLVFSPNTSGIMTNGPNITIEAQGYKLFTISYLQMHEVNLIKKKVDEIL